MRLDSKGQLCAGQEVAIVGGGNSAGQAAVYLSQIANHVQVLVRGAGLVESMSRYLIRRTESTPNVNLGTRCHVTELDGTDGWNRWPGRISTLAMSRSGRSGVSS